MYIYKLISTYVYVFAIEYHHVSWALGRTTSDNSIVPENAYIDAGAVNGHQLYRESYLWWIRERRGTGTVSIYQGKDYWNIDVCAEREM